MRRKQARDRALIIAGALSGLLGTIAAGMAAHETRAGASLDTAANFLLFHAPILIAVPLLVRTGLAQAMIARLGGLLVFLGCALFSGELALRALQGRSLFFMAAPTGGTLLMVGWLIIALAALVARRHAEPAS